MIAVKETSPGVFERLQPGQWVESLDGEFKASVETVLTASWTDEERAVFGVDLVEPIFAPANYEMTNTRFERIDGKVLMVADFVPVTPYVAPPAPPSALEFMQRFTADERAAIRASTNAQVEDFFDLLRVAQVVDLNNPLVMEGVGLLVSEALLTQDRADEILS